MVDFVLLKKEIKNKEVDMQIILLGLFGWFFGGWVYNNFFGYGDF